MNRIKDPKNRLGLPDVALPWHQQLVMRFYLGPFVASSSNPGHSRELYEAFTAKIVQLAQEIPFNQHRIPVLVPAQVGLLDDTRYWSISQTLEHLLKLDALTKDIVLKLAAEVSPQLEVTPGMVAPEGKCDPEKIFEDYRAFVPTQLDEIAEALSSTKSTLTEAHPLFGPFDAKQWFWSMSMRTSLRYRQLKNIRKGLTFDPSSERRLSLLPKSPGV